MPINISFSEYSLYQYDPVYTFSGNTVKFGSYFQGQSVSGSVITGAPNPGLLTLVQNSNTYIYVDGANPTSPVLSGIPTYSGPISFSFSSPVGAVGLAAGYFDSIGSTTIKAFGSNGQSLGTWTNSQYGIEYYGLRDNAGS